MSIFMLVTRVGALAAGVLGSEDILALDLQTFTLTQ
jgi:hypothetical protein